MKKIISIAFVVFFCTVLFVPFLMANKVNGTVSENEKRILADTPTAAFMTEEYKQQVTAWLNDNIGLRGKMLGLRALFMNKCLGVSTSEKVQKGKDGWYFYTYDNNLEIARGTYPVDEEKLIAIADVQQKISDYYKQQGIDYVLVLTPSKVSIYPEYLYGNYDIRETPCDMIYNYLTENTDITVVNVKSTLLEHKDDGQLFWKHGTHWTRLGAYYAYRAIADTLTQKQIAQINQFEIVASKQDYNGEFSAMLGMQGILETESGDSVDFVQHSVSVADGAFFESLDYIVKQNSQKSVHQNELFINDAAADRPRLQIYGDSQFMSMRQLPTLLAESFSATLNVGRTLRVITPELDSVFGPDVVIYSCSERYTADLLDVLPDFLAEDTETIGD